MMPPEGSFMHWFLTDRSLHLYITLVRKPSTDIISLKPSRHTKRQLTQGILLSLTFGIWYQDFVHKTPYYDLLPPNSMLFAHPVTFFYRWAEVYQMHVNYVSQETAERRRQKVEDVQKRSEYRKAHGLEDQNEGKDGGLFGGWTAKAEAQKMGPALREGGEERVNMSEPSAAEMEVVQGAVAAVDAAEEETFVDFEGKTQPLKKKWFGIW